MTRLVLFRAAHPDAAAIERRPHFVCVVWRGEALLRAVLEEFAC